MNQQEMLIHQLQKWIEITANFAEETSKKEEYEITKEDIISLAQKVEDVQNVLIGKSKMSGWRL